MHTLQIQKAMTGIARRRGLSCFILAFSSGHVKFLGWIRWSFFFLTWLMVANIAQMLLCKCDLDVCD